MRLKSLFCSIILTGVVSVGASASPVSSVVYSMLPPAGTFPDPTSSIAYYEQNVSDYGALVQQTAPGGTLLTGTVYLDNWASQSAYSSYTGYGSNSSYLNLPVTLTLYAVGANDGNGNPTVGAPLGTLTNSNPELAWVTAPRTNNAGTDCNGAGSFATGNGTNPYACGVVTAVNFDFSSLGISLPSQFIYDVSYATSLSDPSSSVNLSLTQYTNSGSEPLVGFNPYPDLAFCAAGPGPNADYFGCGNPFQNVPNGGGYFASNGSPAVAFTATPEPATFGLIGLSLVGLVGAVRKYGKKA